MLTTIQAAEKYYKKGTFNGLIDGAKRASSALQNVSEKGQQGAHVAEHYKRKLVELQREFSETKASATNLHGSLLEIVKGFAKFQLAARLVMKPLQLLRNAWNDFNETLVETEDAVVALRRVAGEMANADELYELAQRYGQTFENVTDIATNFARAGYSWVDTIKATESALLALNTAELDASQASDGMIAILQQFGYEASDLESIIDKLNITADNAAVSTDKLLTALQRTGSSAKNANLSLEETVGLITALSESTGRSGENLGTAINSLIQFSTKSSSLDVFENLGGSVASAVEDYRKGAGTVLDIWRELSGVVGSANTSTQSILGGLFVDEDWRNLNEQLQEELGENFATVTEIYGTASTFRKNYFIALLQNLDQVDESLQTMQKSQGYSQKENEQYLDTYTAKVNTLKAKWQEIANDEQGFLGFKKGLVDTGIVLLEIFDTLGGIRSIAFGIGGALIGGGWGAILGAGVSAIISAISDYKKAQEQQREIAISTWEANEKNANALEELYAKYQQLTPADDEFLSIQKELVTALGDKATALEGLTVGSEEYTKAVEKMTEAELELYRVQQRSAAFSTKKENDEKKRLVMRNDLATRRLLYESGVISQQQYESGSIATGTGTEIYEVVSKSIDALTAKYNELIRQGKFDEANAIINASGYQDLVGWQEKYRSNTNDYLRTNTAKLLSDYEISRGIKVDTQDEFDKALKFIIDQLGTSDFYDETIKGFLGSMVRVADEEQPSGGSGTTSRSEIVDTLKAIRDNTKQSKEIEEKLLALEEARNSRTVRVFNAETGQWEMQANEKNVAKAEKGLHDYALDTVINALGKDGSLPEGFEIPDWLANIMKPTSEEQFANFFTSMGVLAGIYNKTPSSGGVVSNSNSNTTNNNQSYILNGVAIPKEIADKYNLPELFETMLMT